MPNTREQEKYFMESNAAEILRLSFQHEVLKEYIGRLVLAPVNLEKPDLRILDSATADGLWLRDLQSAIPPGSTLVGTDIVESYFPPKGEWPSNVSLSIHSITKPWPLERQQSFDLVHQRFALPAAGRSGLKEALKGLVGLVKPGGWIQLVEADHSVFTGSAMGELFELVKEIFGAMDVGYDHARELKDKLIEAGLETITEEIYDVPLGSKNPNPEMARKSAYAYTLGAAGIVAAARRTPSCTWSSERLDAVEPNVERELQDHGGVSRAYFVWGRQPQVSQ